MLEFNIFDKLLWQWYIYIIQTLELCVWQLSKTSLILTDSESFEVFLLRFKVTFGFKLTRIEETLTFVLDPFLQLNLIKWQFFAAKWIYLRNVKNYYFRFHYVESTRYSSAPSCGCAQNVPPHSCGSTDHAYANGSKKTTVGCSMASWGASSWTG